MRLPRIYKVTVTSSWEMRSIHTFSYREQLNSDLRHVLIEGRDYARFQSEEISTDLLAQSLTRAWKMRLQDAVRPLRKRDAPYCSKPIITTKEREKRIARRRSELKRWKQKERFLFFTPQETLILIFLFFGRGGGSKYKKLERKTTKQAYKQMRSKYFLQFRYPSRKKNSNRERRTTQ